MTRIKASNYSIFIANECYNEINRFLKASKNKYYKLFILVDENSLKYCYPKLVEKVTAFKDAELIEIESGEEAKSIEICQQIWSLLSEYGATRDSLFVNLGGGVISDLGGFVASTFKRGIDFINIPTTLLSQVDASVGGKVGIDFNNLKNEIGAFAHPKAVFIDTTFLSTLNNRQLLSGFAEIIKHALIADIEFWKELKKINLSFTSQFEAIIERSVRIKNKIVSEDSKEHSIRKSLNFGHTIGHALESLYLSFDSKNSLLHGEAIAVGIICEAYLSHKLNKLKRQELNEITKFITALYKPITIIQKDYKPLLDFMQHDKKNNANSINFTLLKSIGNYEINQTAAKEEIIEAIQYYNQQLVSLN